MKSKKALEKEFNHYYSRFKYCVGLLLFFIVFALVMGVDKPYLFYTGVALGCFSLYDCIDVLINIKKKLREIK